jgi:hypothetical protein
MQMVSSIISELWPLVQRRDLLSSVNGVVERLTFSRYWPLDLVSSYQFWICSHGCREEVCSCNICPACYVLDNGDSYSHLPNDIDQAVWLPFPSILVLVFLHMVID